MFLFLRISRERQFREFKNLVKINITIALLKKNQKILNYKLREKVQNQKFVKIWTRENDQIYSN